MSLGAVFGPINSTSVGDMFGSASATAADGSSVVAWIYQPNPANFADVYVLAQRYNSFGGKIGPQILVAFSGTVGANPSVAMDDEGQFVVSYTQAVGNDTNVLAQRFNSDGNPVGGPVPVGVGTFYETDSRVAMDLRGDFVVSYTRDTNNNNPDIFAKLYNSNGQLLDVISVATSSAAEIHSSVAMTPDGRFDVAWEQVFTANDHDIWEKSYNASGVETALNAVAFSSAMDVTPSIAMDNAGDAVVAWQQTFSIKARRIDPTGAMSQVINIYNGPDYCNSPKVGAKPGGGGFVVGYADAERGGEVAEVSAFGTVTTLGAGGFVESVSFDEFGDYLITFSTGTNIYGQRGYLPF